MKHKSNKNNGNKTKEVFEKVIAFITSPFLSVKARVELALPKIKYGQILFIVSSFIKQFTFILPIPNLQNFGILSSLSFSKL